MRRYLVLIAAALAAAGCQETRGVRIVSSPYADGAKHTEPVFYNGKHYDVSFQFNAAADLYQVTVAGKGRRLSGTPGDQQIIEQVAVSAIRHFACPTGQRGQVVPGSIRHGDGAWALEARCA